MSQFSLEGKVAIVTGAASGIGRSTATRFAQAGAQVVIADLNESGGADVAAEINDAAGTRVAVAVTVDVTASNDTDHMVQVAETEFGRIDVLSCNAGLARYPKSAMDVEESEFDQIFAVNVKGLWLCARSAIPGLRRAGGGAIIITGSVMGERTRPGFLAYASSKAAANHLARTLALELADDAIRVNCLAPVATDTAMLPSFLGLDDPDGARERFIASIPLGRLAEPEDIANAATFLASDAARFITGVVLPVDGGRSI